MTETIIELKSKEDFNLLGGLVYKNMDISVMPYGEKSSEIRIHRNNQTLTVFVITCGMTQKDLTAILQYISYLFEIRIIYNLNFFKSLAK